jgi:hypothetical protein
MGKKWKHEIDLYRGVAWACQDCRDSMSDMIEFFPGLGAPYLKESDPLSYTFWTGGWGGYTEVYADIYAAAKGNINNIPPSLRPFYDLQK